jgi:adenylosuccinate synthase
MVRRADVVIGSAFGDEGKGLITDVLTARHPGDTLVVRFNGGAQAGHTVVTPDGKRHVFSHFGSGTLSGAATFLSRFFVVNPVLFQAERERLLRLGVSPQVFIDPRAPVTTPFDMFVNTALERHRGSSRHGSCGVGFGETVGRNEDRTFALTVADLSREGGEQAVRQIRDGWLPQRLASLGLQMTAEERATLLSEALLRRFMDDVALMLESSTLAGQQILRLAGHVVFEGAQGLLLDQQMGCFPYVTRSHTGLRNVGALIEGTGITSLDVHYVLRPYLTRHGAGPLPGELAQPPYPAIKDNTNVPNPWQGSLRFALQSIDLLRASIARDLRHAELRGQIELSKQLAVTCLDQVGGEVHFLEDGEEITVSPEAFVLRCMQAVGADQGRASYAPERSSCACLAVPRKLESLRGRSKLAHSGSGSRTGTARSPMVTPGMELRRVFP